MNPETKTDPHQLQKDPIFKISLFNHQCHQTLEIKEMKHLLVIKTTKGEVEVTEMIKQPIYNPTSSTSTS